MAGRLPRWFLRPAKVDTNHQNHERAGAGVPFAPCASEAGSIAGPIRRVEAPLDAGLPWRVREGPPPFGPGGFCKPEEHRGLPRIVGWLGFIWGSPMAIGVSPLCGPRALPEGRDGFVDGQHRAMVPTKGGWGLIGTPCDVGDLPHCPSPSSRGVHGLG